MHTVKTPPTSPRVTAVDLAAPSTEGATRLSRDSEAHHSTLPSATDALTPLGHAHKPQDFSTAPRSIRLTPERQARNHQQAISRADTFFGEKPESIRLADLQEATIEIDHELNSRGDVVPADARDLMIDMRADMNDVDRAVPYGRGNGLVRHGESGPGPGTIDFASTFEKHALKFIGDKVFESIVNPRGERRPIQFSAKEAATAIETGAGSCVHYTHLFALKMALRLNANPELKDRIALTLYSSPFKEEGKPRVDHVYGELSYRCRNGETVRIAFNPFAERSRVTLSKNSPFHGGFEEPGAYLKSVGPEIHTLVRQHMDIANDLLPDIRNAPDFDEKLAGIERYAKDRQVDGKVFTVGDTMGGFVDVPVDDSKPGVPPLPVRRRSLIPARNSPLLSDE